MEKLGEIAIDAIISYLLHHYREKQKNENDEKDRTVANISILASSSDDEEVYRVYTECAREVIIDIKI